MAFTKLIEYEGDNSTFIWKHPQEDFETLSQLVVHESQEAIFFMNGQALDTFGPGRHTLDTGNLPGIGKKFMNLVSGKRSPFHCEVYFINKTVQMGIKWGTDSRVRYIDPDSGIPLEIGACGEMNVEVADSRKLLVKLVGTMRGVSWDEKTDKAEREIYGKKVQEKADRKQSFTKTLQQSFRPLISTAVKSNLTAAIKNINTDILEVDEHLEELSAVLKEKIVPGFMEYGLSIPQFYITTVLLPEEDKSFQKIRELHTIGLQKLMIEAEAEVKTAQAQSEIGVTAARRMSELERQTTQTEILKREQERRLIEAQAEAERKRMLGTAEAEVRRAEGLAAAEVMRAKGYSEKDVLQADVQKAYAAGLGQIGANSSGCGMGSGNGSSLMGDLVGLGLGIKAAGVVTGQMDNLFSGIGPTAQPAAKEPSPVKMKPEAYVCKKCGAEVPENGKFCLECGEKVVRLAEDEIICPSCGMKTTKGNFCMECGAPLVKKCPNCGAVIKSEGKFCMECGTKL